MTIKLYNSRETNSTIVVENLRAPRTAVLLLQVQVASLIVCTMQCNAYALDRQLRSRKNVRPSVRPSVRPASVDKIVT